VPRSPAGAYRLVIAGAAYYHRSLERSLEHLTAAFAELDQEKLREATLLQRSNRDARLLKRVRALVADEPRPKNDATIDRYIRQSDASVTEI
jgi:benzoyl-CoA reductase/2-hydroxyglutaryl-CoA dehydratase subunit BcrC/BadD/HgdB